MFSKNVDKKGGLSMEALSGIVGLSFLGGRVGPQWDITTHIYFRKKKTARKAVTYVEASLGKVDPILSQGDEGEYQFIKSILTSFYLYNDDSIKFQKRDIKIKTSTTPVVLWDRKLYFCR